MDKFLVSIDQYIHDKSPDFWQFYRWFQDAYFGDQNRKVREQLQLDEVDLLNAVNDLLAYAGADPTPEERNDGIGDPVRISRAAKRPQKSKHLPLVTIQSALITTRNSLCDLNLNTLQTLSNFPKLVTYFHCQHLGFSSCFTASFPSLLWACSFRRLLDQHPRITVPNTMTTTEQALSPMRACTCIRMVPHAAFIAVTSSTPGDAPEACAR